MSDPGGIAIVGMSSRVPGAASVHAFWRNLLDGVESISFFTRDELAEAGVPQRTLAHPGYVGASAVLPDIDRFDAKFFGFSAREAALLDPQGRLLIECIWEALEDAGHVPGSFDGLIGVFGGVGASRYFMRNLLPGADQLDGAGAYQAMIANDKDFIPSWASYKLNLTGPSVAVQTACSTSLVAVHLACQSLLTYQCDLALAGGVSLALDAKAGYIFQEGGILSPDGHCRPFDAAARGTVHGSGAGVVALRRLEDAIADGDAIIAVIRGSAINNDGAVKVGFTAPSVDGQSEVIAMAHAVAGVDASAMGFVEGHGTATALGDPVEVAALTRVFRRQTDARAFCALGSVKSNVGHLDAAAGVTGLIKASLAIRDGQIPPTLHFQAANPQIDFAASPFYVNAETRKWPAGSSPRIAGVSSFGIGGTNAHVVIQEAPAPRTSSASRSWQVLALSALTPTALDASTDALADAIDADDAPPLADIAFTLLAGRKPLPHRRVVICQTAGDAVDALDDRDPARVFTAAAPDRDRSTTFMFPGQGSQHVDMARDLYETESAFRQELDRCAEIVRGAGGPDLRAILFPAPADRAHAADQLARTDVSQLALFSVEYSLARMLMAIGVTPQSFIGHSVGEYVAACLAGVFTLEDALGTVAERGRLMAEMPAGEMLAVSAPEADVKSWIDPTELSIAVVNSHNACVVSGPADAVDALIAALNTRGILHRRLDVSRAFHSHMMDAALPQFRAFLNRVTFRAPQMPFISNVTGTWIRAEDATDREYWVRQLRRTVYFADGLSEVLKDPNRVAIEVGPGRTLQALALQQRARQSTQEILAILPDVRDARSSTETLAITVGRLWMSGVTIDWARYFARETRNRVHLPTYPFERERHWIEPIAATTPHIDARERQPFAKWFYAPAWKQSPAETRATDRVQSWLVVDDGTRLAADVTHGLRARGQHVTVMEPAAAPQLVETPDCIVCFPTTFSSLLPLVQAISDRTHGRQCVINVVQSGVQCVTGDESIVPAHATVLGVCRVLPQENPDIRCRHIDVVPPEDDASRARVADQVISELLVDPEAAMVAFRGRLRWTVSQERLNVVEGRQSRFKTGGVYWITGGTGGIGLSLAEYLATTYQARVVLSGRNALRSGVADVQARLEKLGGEVLVVQADAARRDEMHRAADAVAARFGSVDGVIHAAGVGGGRLMSLETLESVDAVMRPKTDGSVNLDDVMRRFNPDFVLYCSSLAVELGGLGQASYAAANAFLDAQARSRSANDGCVAISVNWDRWRDVGMAAALADANAIGSDDGARALEAILSLGLPKVAVSTLDLPARVLATSAVTEHVDAAPLQARPALSTDYIRPTTEPEAAMAVLWQEILGLGQVGIDDNFFELGGDSLTALRFTALYRERTNRSVPVTALYAAPTIRRFLLDAAAAPADTNTTKTNNTGARS